MWLGQASGRPCHNLDFYCMSHDEILSTVGQYSADADISLIEGNKGLYDGLDLHGSNSNAALARLDALLQLGDHSAVKVQADRFDANVVYAVFNNHKMADFKPYVLKSTNRGRTWTS